MSRLIAFGLSTPLKQVPEAVLVTLDRLRSHADQLVVVAPAGYRAQAPSWQRLESMVDSVWHSEGEVTPASGLSTLIGRAGSHVVAEFDEVIWLDDTVLGPIEPLDEFPSLYGREGCDAWTLTALDIGEGPERADLHFLGVRGAMFEEPNVRAALAAEPPTFSGLVDALRNSGVAIGIVRDRANDHEVFLLRDSLPRLLGAGLEFVPWKALTLDPLVCDRWGIVPRDTFDTVVARGYPAEAIWDSLLKQMAPRDWYTNLAMAEVLPSDATTNAAADLRTAVLIHVYYVDMLEELLERAANLPGWVRVVLTTDTTAKQEVLRAKAAGDTRFVDIEVRVVTSNRGRDISAFIIDCADVLRDPSIELVVKLHSKRSVQDPGSVSSWFRRHLFDNLLESPGYARNVIELFEREPGLGMVFPPTIHMGLPTMGHAWSANKKPARTIAARLGIDVPFDETTPLSPYGSMFIARREALSPLLEANFAISEFPDADEYQDGSLAHVLERLVSYGAIGSGYYVKSVCTTRLAGISSAVMEYKLQAVGASLPPHALQQVASFHGDGEVWPVRLAVQRHVKVWIRRKSPIALALLRLLKRTLGALRRSLN